MDPIRNPYVPGAGTPPPELAGRTDIIGKADIALKRLAAGKPIQSPILIGLRGVGKTVLLVKIEEIAEGVGFKSIFIEAHEGKNLPSLIAPGFRKILIQLSKMEKAKEAARMGLRVLKSFVKSVKFTVGEMDYGLSIDPELGVADSGDLESDLPDLFRSVGDVARESGCPIVIFIDELQNLSMPEFSALIMAMHQINQRSLPIILIGGGLPQILGLAGNSKSYSERLFTFPEIGPLSAHDAEDALKNPATEEGVVFEREAIAKVIELTEGYPYFLQQWAYDAWNLATGNTITKEDVVNATGNAIAALDESFFKVRLDRCTPSEQRYMRALAELGPGMHRSGDIAEKLGIKVESASPTRSGLIKKGMVYAPSHGDTAFTVPLFDQFMRRAIPEFSP